MSDLNQTIETKVDDNFKFDDASAIEKLMVDAGADDEPLATDEGETKAEPDQKQPDEGGKKEEPPAKESGQPPAAATDAKDTTKVDGVLARDGKHVLPFDVLEGERRAKAELKAENERLKAQLAEREANEKKAKRAEDDKAFEAEMAAIEQDMPAIAARMRADRRERLELEERIAKATAVPTPAPAGSEPTPEEIKASVRADMGPLLRTWGDKGGALWKEACDLDVQLEADPAWKGRPRAERFAEVERQIASQYGIPVPSASSPSPSPSPAPAAAPTPPVQQAKPVSSLSDLRGTPPVTPTEVDWETANVHDQLAKAMSVSTEELVRSVGVPY